MPNQMMNKGASAILGIEYRAVMYGSRTSANARKRPNNKPKAKPTKEPIKNPHIVAYSVMER